jgi:hypothetical protein
MGRLGWLADRALAALEDGKADNYVSTNAREYLLSGTVHVELSSTLVGLEETVRVQKIDELVDRRLADVARSVRTHVDSACGDGFRCARLFEDPDLFYLPKQCLRRDHVCGG